MAIAQRTIAVGLSGGADSSMAAFLLREQGWGVVGITLRLWQDPAAGPTEAPIERARNLAHTLGIPHHVIDLREAFREQVVTPFIAQYRLGLTPSPCVGCNLSVKFGLMLDAALGLGCARLATGHYARTDVAADGRVRLLRGRDPVKDQSYFLAGLRQEQLARATFPLGDLTKVRVAAEARRLGLVPQTTPESQDLCFIPDGDVVAFLRRAAGASLPGPGEIVTRDGHVLGRHPGAVGFTIGQRRGLGLGGGPWYVLQVDPATNRIVVGRSEECASRDVPLRALNWLCPVPPPGTRLDVQAQVRYAMRATPAVLEVISPDRGARSVARPVHAITPGQFAVLYQADEVLAGAWIEAPGQAPAEEDPPR